jgi:SAM-dependent methyltransferase
MTAPGEARFERDYYRTVYPDYARQNPPRKLHFYRGLAEQAASGIDAPRILDVGCAFGAFLACIDPRWARFGVDVSRFAIESAAASVPGVTFARAGFSDLSFSTPFDVITAFDVIEHVPELEAVADAVKSHLKPGGHWIFVVPVYDGLTGPIIRLLDRDTTHVHKRSRDFWLRWAGEHFELIAWLGIYRSLVPGLGYLHLPTRAARRFTPAIAVVARKPA